MCSWRRVEVVRLHRTERIEGRGVVALVLRCRGNLSPDEFWFELQWIRVFVISGCNLFYMLL